MSCIRNRWHSNSCKINSKTLVIAFLYYDGLYSSSSLSCLCIQIILWHQEPLEVLKHININLDCVFKPLICPFITLFVILFSITYIVSVLSLSFFWFSAVSLTRYISDGTHRTRFFGSESPFPKQTPQKTWVNSITRRPYDWPLSHLWYWGWT